jgi:hypothetical protein
MFSELRALPAAAKAKREKRSSFLASRRLTPAARSKSSELHTRDLGGKLSFTACNTLGQALVAGDMMPQPATPTSCLAQASSLETGAERQACMIN